MDSFVTIHLLFYFQILHYKFYFDKENIKKIKIFIFIDSNFVDKKGCIKPVYVFKNIILSLFRVLNFNKNSNRAYKK